MAKSKTLLEKYDIPLNHLDFVYVDKCENAREMEKIVQILRSGEEGHFPDLLRSAEQKLKQLKPDSKLFRYEEPIRRADATLDATELKPIYDWTHQIKHKDNAMAELKEDMAQLTANLPAMRKPAKIDIEKSAEPAKLNAAPAAATKKDNPQRIKSTDYSKWDKYDPEEELLRMDLQEERNKQQVEYKNQDSIKRAEETLTKICEAAADDQRIVSQLAKLSQLERQEYAERYRLRGNEYFRAKEYESAIAEYSRAIVYDAHAARAYNNRAVSQMKLKNYVAAIEDCEACLKLEPDNLKALLRLADANYAQGRRIQSYDVYQQVLQLEPSNSSALKAVEQLRQQLGEVAPANATRLTIEEHNTAKPKAKTVQAKQQATPLASAPAPAPAAATAPAKDYDLAELVKPNRVVQSKLMNAAQAALAGQLKGNAGNANTAAPTVKQMATTMMPQLSLPTTTTTNNNNNKLLIQEL